MLDDHLTRRRESRATAAWHAFLVLRFSMCRGIYLHDATTHDPFPTHPAFWTPGCLFSDDRASCALIHHTMTRTRRVAVHIWHPPSILLILIVLAHDLS